MGLFVDWLGIDCADPTALVRFWTAALGYTVADDDDPNEVLIAPKDGGGPRLLFLRVPEGKQVKNRLHLDLRPNGQDSQDDEVERLTGLGARRVDVGQGDVSWVVLADPEGNEFCVLRTLTDEDRAKREAQGLD
jgi:predicted enzyme related to lactoylglutathione lyase